MSDQNTTLRDDIAFLRSLAEAGRGGPMTGGSILLAAGLIYAACAFTTWYAAGGGLGPLDGLFMPALWFGATGLFVLILFMIKRRMPETTASARSAGIVWMGAGWAVFAMVVSLMIMSYRANAWWVMGAICPLILATYGGAWSVAGLITKSMWLRLVGVGSFAMALVCAWYGLEIRNLFLLYGVSLLALVALPGFVLMRQARSAG